MECIVILQCETSVRIVSGKLPELLRAESKLGSTCTTKFEVAPNSNSACTFALIHHDDVQSLIGVGGE